MGGGLMARCFDLEGVREVGSRSRERRRGGTSVTGRGSSSVGNQRASRRH
jgi:hypothetical protein